MGSVAAAVGLAQEQPLPSAAANAFQAAADWFIAVAWVGVTRPLALSALGVH